VLPFYGQNIRSGKNTRGRTASSPRSDNKTEADWLKERPVVRNADGQQLLSEANYLSISLLLSLSNDVKLWRAVFRFNV
jgi:hypothetical protein